MTWLFNLKYFGIEIMQQSLSQDSFWRTETIDYVTQRNAEYDHHYIYNIYVICFYEQAKKDLHGWQEYTTKTVMAVSSCLIWPIETLLWTHTNGKETLTQNVLFQMVGLFLAYF
jgi:hypothetical protein